MTPDREALIHAIELRTDIAKRDHHGFVDFPYEMVGNVLALLKEQEAIKPEREHSGSGVTWWNVCGNCKTAINPNDKFCHECGRPVLWEGR